MLLELNIENYAIIEDMKINFQKGLNVITGETGSGKSIIIDALGMVLGGRANKDVIKAGKDFCHIEAIFTTYDKDIKDLLESMGIEVDDYLIITKDISKNGPSITRINNRVITSSNLLKIIPKIIDVTRAVITGIIGSIVNLKIDSGISLAPATFDAIFK